MPSALLRPFLFTVLLLWWASPALAATPALFRLEQGGQVSWLFGVLPYGPATDDPLPEPVRRAVQASARGVVEVRQPLPRERSMAFLSSLQRDDRSVQALLPVPDREAYQALCELRRLPCAALDKLPPLVVASALNQMLLPTLGLRRQPSDSQSQVQALLGDKPLLELEPPESLATTLQTLEPAEQLPVMQRLLREQGQDALRALTAWQQGDLESLGQNLDQVALPAAARQTLFDQRQQRWAEEIARAMKSGEPLFIAVAAGHLSGAQGLPQRLASLGIQVERWRY